MRLLSDDPIGVDAIAALESCAATLGSCDVQALDGILSRLMGIPADRRVLDAIGRGLNAPDPIVGVNPFFAPSLVIPVLQAHAFSSPDVAVTYVVQGINNFLQTTRVADPAEDQNPNAFLAQAIGALVGITPATQRNSKDRVRLSLLSLADLGGRLPRTAERAQAALQKLTGMPPGSAPVSHTRSKIIGVLLGGTGLVGALAVILWKLGSRLQPGGLALAAPSTTTPRSKSRSTSTSVRPRAIRSRIRKGTRGRIVNVDNNQRAAFFDGARVCVRQRLHRPDEVLVELLDDGPGWPGGTWRHGTIGTIPLRYFVPD